MSAPMVIGENEVHRVPLALRIPIAAASVEAVQRHAGDVESLREGMVLLVTRRGPAPVVPPALRELGDLTWLHPPRQLWVHVDLASYREAFERAFGPVGDQFVDHVFNRKLAREHGYRYLRLVPVAPRVNTSGGRGLEDFTVKTLLERLEGPDAKPLAALHHQIPAQSQICYAGPFAIAKMLNLPPGNRHTLPGVQQVYAAMMGH